MKKYKVWCKNCRVKREYKVSSSHGLDQNGRAVQIPIYICTLCGTRVTVKVYDE